MAPRYILAENLKQLMAERPDLCTLAKITQRTGVSNGTLDRIRRAEVSTTVDVLERLAAAFDLEAWELLVPASRRPLLHSLRLVAEAAAPYHPTAATPAPGTPARRGTGKP